MAEPGHRTPQAAESRRSSNIILFDGICGLCTRSVQFIIRRDPSAVFSFASLQSETGRALAESHGVDTQGLETLVLLQDGEALLRSDAVLAVAARLGGVWRAVAALRQLPRFVREPIYRAVAENRYRWFGRRDACWVPPSDVGDRFL